MNGAWSIEVAGPADAESAGRLHYLSHIKSFAPFVPAEWVATREPARYVAQWQEFFAKNAERSRAWVARPTGSSDPVGIVKIIPMPEDGFAQLSSIHVHPEYHGRGIGSGLMSVAEEFIREAGYGRAILGVIQANVKARALYDKFGWSIVDERPIGVEGVPVYTYGKTFG